MSGAGASRERVHKVIREAFANPENHIGPGPYHPRIDANGRHWIADRVLAALDAEGYRVMRVIVEDPIQGPFPTIGDER